MKILLVKPTALGDVAQAMLVAPALRAWPQCGELAWIIDEAYLPLVQACPQIDTLIPFPRQRWRNSRSFADMIEWARQLRCHRFDLVLDLQGLARSALMTLATGAPRRIGLESSREWASWAYTEKIGDNAVHAVDRYAKAIERIMGSLPEISVWLRPGHLDDRWGLEIRGYVALHPYSLWETKLWPWQFWDKLMAALPNLRFVMVGRGPFFPILSSNCVDLRNRTSLADLISILGNARAILSTDSGPLHLGCALGVPSIGLYGASDPERTGPRGARARALFGDAECRPCLRRKCHAEYRMVCMRQLGMESAIDAIEEFIS